MSCVLCPMGPVTRLMHKGVWSAWTQVSCEIPSALLQLCLLYRTVVSPRKLELHHLVEGHLFVVRSQCALAHCGQEQMSQGDGRGASAPDLQWPVPRPSICPVRQNKPRGTWDMQITCNELLNVQACISHYPDPYVMTCSTHSVLVYFNAFVLPFLNARCLPALTSLVILVLFWAIPREFKHAWPV